ncbi:MAG: hypothetical protein OIN85_01110 [Candidatus Methanoperedens sp.]|nr:hypothetical protein [Candidatus Methanoperedens sp.]
MKSYPSVSKNVIHTQIYAFDKLDGSNIRAEWKRKGKTGFYKFGSRNQLISDEQPFLTEAPELIREKYEEELSRIFTKERYDEATVFFEFHGPNSFAGTHQKEQHTVTMFDVAPLRKGILYPADYLKLFGHLDIAKLLYRGNPTHDFTDSVLEGKLEGMTFEGVVCKAPNGCTPQPIMFKIKSNAWFSKLLDYCKGNAAMFARLA